MASRNQKTFVKFKTWICLVRPSNAKLYMFFVPFILSPDICLNPDAIIFHSLKQTACTCQFNCKPVVLREGNDRTSFTSVLGLSSQFICQTHPWFVENCCFFRWNSLAWLGQHFCNAWTGNKNGKDESIHVYLRYGPLPATVTTQDYYMFSR